MDSAVFKYKQQQQHQLHYQQHFNNSGSNSNNNHNSNSNRYYNHNNNNKQNSIFILNTTTNSILPNHNSKLFYTDLNENNDVLPPSHSNTTADASTSMWLSASSTMCSPAAHAIQKLFNCSSSSSTSSTSLKSNQGIETKSYKTKSELLKKKTKVWKYLEGAEEEAVSVKSNQPGIENEMKNKLKDIKKKSFKYKTKYWLKSSCDSSDNPTNQDLAELLEYSCSLCDNCQCMDCQIAYFDCDNSDDSNSEYSFHLSAYDEDVDENNDNVEDNKVELISTDDCLDKDIKSQQQLEPNFISNCVLNESCQQCLLQRALNHQ